MTLGLRQAGFTVLGAVEIDPLAVESYRANHRKVVVWTKDIREVDPREVMDHLGILPEELSLLGGCPPCQGFSTLRTRNRGREVEDDRNDLVFEFLRFVRALLPAAVMMENVPNLARDVRMEQVLHELRDLGYVVDVSSVRVLDAADYGVPQHRRRMILLAGRGKRLSFASPSVRRRPNVERCIRRLPAVGTSGDPLHDELIRRSERVMALIQAIPKDGGGRLDLPDEHRLACHRSFDGFKDVYGRMAWRRPAPTITSGCYNPSKGRFLHPEEDRAITLREAALLQSFPRRYKFSLRGGRKAVAAQIGNALPPKLIRCHAVAVIDQLEVSRCR